MWNEKVKKYDAIIALHPVIQRKGKTMPYTSANGYMFTLFNKNCEIGFRLPKDIQEAFKKEHNTTIYRSYGAVMKDYVLVPESLWEDASLLKKYLDISHQFVLSLPPK